MRTLDPPCFYYGRRRFLVRLSYYCLVNLIGFWFCQVHSSFAKFVVAPTTNKLTKLVELVPSSLASVY